MLDHPIRLLGGDVRIIGNFNPHRTRGRSNTKAELSLVKHLNRKTNRLWAEVHHERLAFEVAMIIFVHLDLWVTAIDLLRNDSTFRKQLPNLLLLGIKWKIGDPHSGIHARFLGLRRSGLQQTNVISDIIFSCVTNMVTLTSSALLRFFSSRGWGTSPSLSSLGRP